MIEELRQLKSSEITDVREEILEEQNGLCAICGNPITEKTGIALDHQHRFKKDKIGEDGAGLVRGVLCRACNVEDGKIWNSMNRYIQPKNVQERIDFLENLISYYKKTNYNLIHPNEKPKGLEVSKKNYNKLKKLYLKDVEQKIKKRKFPEYPKSKKLSKPLKELFEEYNIEPFNKIK